MKIFSPASVGFIFLDFKKAPYKKDKTITNKNYAYVERYN